MDVVYVCRRGENRELRHSLRSLTNVPHDRVWIFGEPPSWVRNVEVVTRPQRQTKHENALGNFLAALDCADLSDPFWLWNDDFYAVEPTQPGHYHRGPAAKTLAIYRHHHPTGSYTRSIAATIDRLEQHGITDPNCYELHLPLVVHKAAMRDALTLGKGVHRFLYRTAYGNTVDLEAERVDDVKVYNLDQPMPRGPWLSSSDHTFQYLQLHMSWLFPEPGPYE